MFLELMVQSSISFINDNVSRKYTVLQTPFVHTLFLVAYLVSESDSLYRSLSSNLLVAELRKEAELQGFRPCQRPLLESWKYSSTRT